MSRMSGTSPPPFQPTNESCSVSVQQIENGFLVTTTREEGNDYKSTRVFTKTKPVIGVSVVEPTDDSTAQMAPTRLRSAIGLLKQRRK
jgi:hypothetical protein